MTDENFVNAPVSIGELRSDRENNASKWSVRDMLIATLREIDSGKINPEGAVLAYYQKAEGGVRTSYTLAVPNSLMAYGLCTRAIHLIMEASAR